MTTHDAPLRPVFDPTLPPAGRALLAAHPDTLTPASHPLPPPQPAPEDHPDRAIRSSMRLMLVLGLSFAALVTRLVPLMLLAAVLLMGVSLDLLVSSLTTARRGHEPPAQAAARRYHGRYLLPEDFDPTTRALLARAQTAAEAISDSPLTRSGHIDATDNAVVLGHQLWDIATTLHRITQLRQRTDHVQAQDHGLDVTDLIAERHAAVRQAETSITRRVEALETYAAHIATAEQHHRRLNELNRLLADQHHYRDLLAATAADDHALTDIDHLTQRARAAEAHLRQTLAEAADAARGLTPRDPPGDTPT